MNKHIHFTSRITSILAYVALAVFILMPGRGWGANLINENIQSWTSRASYGSYTQAITAGTVTMTACIISPTATANGTGSLGNVQMQATNGIIAFPALPSCGTVEFHIFASGTNRTVKLQSFNGSAWVDVTTISGIGTTGATFTFPVNSSTSTLLRLASPSAAINVCDIIITDYIGGNDPNLAISGNTAHGSVCPGSPATPIIYTITNSGTIAATGISVASSDGQFVVSGLSSTTIAPGGGTATYIVTFTPSSAGAKSATVTVTSSTSGSNSPTSLLTGTGSATAAQIITSSSAGSVTAQGATLNGTVTNLGACPAATERGFVYSVTATDASPRVGEAGVTKAVVPGMSTTAYSLAVTGLLSSTNYTFTSFVYNGSSYTYGSDRVFTTSAALSLSGTLAHGTTCPGVAATPITYTITNSGAIQVDGLAAVSSGTNATDFVVSSLSSTTIAAGGTATYVVTFTPSSSGSKTATITVSSTTPGILSATNTLTGTGYAQQAVTTSAASNVVNTTATLNGNMTTIGVCPATTLKGFVYSLTSENPDPVSGGTGVTTTSGVAAGSTGAYTLALTGLTPGTSYTYKAYVYNGVTYNYGAATTFTTLSSATKLAL